MTEQELCRAVPYKCDPGPETEEDEWERKKRAVMGDAVVGEM
jgi:hypothetical protein